MISSSSCSSCLLSLCMCLCATQIFSFCCFLNGSLLIFLFHSTCQKKTKRTCLNQMVIRNGFRSGREEEKQNRDYFSIVAIDTNRRKGSPSIPPLSLSCLSMIKLRYIRSISFQLSHDDRTNDNTCE